MKESSESPDKKPLKVHPLLSSLIPPSPKEQYEALELDLIEYGCKDPVITWNGYIVDGHKRYAICVHYAIPFQVQKSHFSTLNEAIACVCELQLQRKDLDYGWYRYLIGKWYIAERAMAMREAKLSRQTRQPVPEASASRKRCLKIAKKQSVSYGTVYKYRFYAEAIDQVFRSAPRLAGRILTDQLKLSHQNTLYLSSLTLEELGALEKAVIVQGLDYLSGADIRQEILWARTRAHSSRHAASKKEPSFVTAQIKNMPKYDPDAEVSSLAFTIPSWCSMINRSMKVSNLSKVSEGAKSRLLAQLLTLRSQADLLIESIKEQEHE